MRLMRLLRVSPTLVNLVNLVEDHRFISEEYYLHIRTFGEVQNKATKAYSQSGQYHM